jgi:hypothetical protein
MEKFWGDVLTSVTVKRCDHQIGLWKFYDVKEEHIASCSSVLKMEDVRSFETMMNFDWAVTSQKIV